MVPIIALHVTQVRVFEPDEIPFGLLMTRVNSKKINQELSFRQAVVIPATQSGDPFGCISFSGGTIADDEGAIYVIEQVSVESRRVIITVAADSSIADKTFEKLRTLFFAIDNRPTKPSLEPIVLTNETTTVAKFSFPFSKLFATGDLGKFYIGMNKMVEQPNAKPLVFPSSIRFRVSYTETPQSFRDQKVEILDKDIVIEHRIGTALEDNVFFISSPNRSEMHLKLIESLEKTFT